MAAAQCQLIHGDGTVASDSLRAFSASTGLAAWGEDYQVVAIMGPQSSGKVRSAACAGERAGNSPPPSLVVLSPVHAAEQAVRHAVRGDGRDDGARPDDAGTNFFSAHSLRIRRRSCGSGGSGADPRRQGVWLAHAATAGGSKPVIPTLVLDLEGTDGRERGDEDTKFEKQARFGPRRR